MTADPAAVPSPTSPTATHRSLLELLQSLERIRTRSSKKRRPRRRPPARSHRQPGLPKQWPAEPFRFFASEVPRKWNGRYARVPGKSTTFRVTAGGRVYLIWRRDNDVLRCFADPTPDVRELGRLLIKTQPQLKGGFGGSFLINEFGQVICPLQANNELRIYLGETSGSLTFRTPDGTPFTLNGYPGLKPGDEWNLPYIGIPHRVSSNGEIYFSTGKHDDETRLCPKRQDSSLIRALLKVRGGAGGRFIVNPHGIVLTRIKVGKHVGSPLYVGRIDRTCWFGKDTP